MTLASEQVKSLAELANLKLSLSVFERYSSEFSDILDYVETIKSLNLKKVEPMSHASLGKNVLRKDKLVDRGIATPDFFRTKPILAT